MMLLAWIRAAKAAYDIIKFVIFVLPDLIKLLRKIYEASFGNKNLAKACVGDLCRAENIRSSVEGSLRKGKGPIQ